VGKSVKARWFVALFLVAALIGALLVGFYAPVKRAFVSALVDMVFGSRVSMRDLEIGSERTVVLGLHAERRGRTVFDADRIEVSYRLHDIFPGGKRRFGLVGFTIDHPLLWLTREPDGGFNLPSILTRLRISGGGGSSNATPLRFSGSIKDAAVSLVDPYRLFAASHEQHIDHLNVVFNVDSAGLTHYEAHGDFEDGGSRPLRLIGTIDRKRGFSSQRLTAEALPLPAALNYLMNTNAAVVLGGVAHNLNVRAYAPNIGSDGHASYHMSGSADLADGILHVVGFRTPIREISGNFDVFDDGVIMRNVHGTLASVPLTAFGGIYGISQPRFRLFISGEGELERLRAAFPFSMRLPVRGQAAFAATLEGRVSNPTALVRFSAPRVAYGRFPINEARGLLAYHKRGVDLLPATANYGGIAVDARGHIDLSAGSPMRFDVETDTDAANIPYAAQIVPQAHLHGSAALFGPASALEVRGALDGAGGGDTLLALAHVDAHGEGAFAPLVATRADGSSLAGAFYLDRPRNGSAFWADVGRYRFSSGRGRAFPGLEQQTPPDFSGVLDGVIGGAGSPSSFALVGRAQAHDARSGSIRFDDIVASFAGSPTNMRLGDVRARGLWGAFVGFGGYAANALALSGAYRGSFEQLRAFTGDVGARGRIASDVALSIDRKRTVVQVRNGAVGGARIRGIPIEHLAGTLEMHGRSLRIDNADLGIAGGNVFVAGGVGGTRRVGVTATGIEVKRLGSPLKSGTLAAVGNFGYEKEARFSGGLLLDGASYAGHRMQGNVDVDLRGATVGFTRSEALFDGTYGVVDGRLLDVGSRRMGYDLGLAVHGADMSAFPALASFEHLDGSIDANMHVAGRGEEPRLQGEVRIPEGSINGLRFQDGIANVDVGPAFAEVRTGSVTVGTTSAAFSGGVVRDDLRAHVNAPKADLADFNDFFDAGDTLGGTGRIIVDFEKKKGVFGIKTGADIAIKDLRYRDFTLGDAAASWKTTNAMIDGRVAFGGASGRLRAGGSIVLARGASAPEMLARSRYDLTTTLQGLDLGVWLPTFGYRVPLVGRVDAGAVLRGRYPNLLLAGNASMNGGSVWSYPIDHFNVTASSNGSRTTIDGMTLDLPSLAVRGSGSFGLGARDPVTLDVHADSMNIGAILTRAIARGRTVFGTLEADLHIDGTRERPRVAGSFDVENAGIRGVAVPRVIGSLALDRNNVIVRNMEADFKNGRLAVTGAVPFTESPPAIGPGKAPVSFKIAAEHIDLSALQPLFPAESKVGGLLDGLLSVEGVASAPRLRGKLALDAGTLATPFEKTPLRNISARVSFGKTKVHLTELHADAGNGTLDAHGTATIADLMQLSADAAYNVTIDAKHAQLDLPAYGSGIADGTVTIEHKPRELPFVYGTMTANDAAVPFSALYRPSGAASVNPPGFDLALDIDTIAAHNVRVRSSNMDIGASGNVNVGGTLSDPKLNGVFTSNGGTLAYFNRVFRVVEGTVTFEPSLGIIPLMNARATTHVFDPNSITGATDITLTLNGSVTNLNIGLDSDPSYDRQQILALLLNEPQLGALLSGGTGVRSASGNQVVGEEAFGLVDAQFTRALLTPLETAFGQALGLSNVNVNFNYGGAVNVSARKLLGKTVNAVYASDVSYPYRQSFGFEVKPNKETSAQLTFYQTLGQTGLGVVNATTIASSTNRVLLSQPLTGTNGFSFSFLQYLR
jgi:autotransporter translocation and assembly factor TamB